MYTFLLYYLILIKNNKNNKKNKIKVLLYTIICECILSVIWLKNSVNSVFQNFVG